MKYIAEANSHPARPIVTGRSVILSRKESIFLVATRKYTPVWTRLKEHGTVKLTVPKPFHKRVIRAVIKEKDLDLGFKLMCSETNSRKRLSYTTHETIITFYLKEFNPLSLL